MGICDSFNNWSTPGYGYGDRLQDVRDWVRDEAASWGIDEPNVVVGKSIDENGEEHWASYDPDTNTITIDPALFNDPEQFSGEDVFNSVAHEFEHAMQWQYGDGMDSGEREADAKDFADAYSEAWAEECTEPDDSESSPGNETGDWNLSPGDGSYA
jgi:hypothetical protein